jgi:solute carrier family 25, member 33/36
MYGGLTPHMLRTVPSAAIMFGIYEGILKFLQYVYSLSISFPD